jgi:uncharacterized protein (TIGR02265 family)
MPLDRSELAERVAATRPSDLLRGSIFHAVLNEVVRRCPEHPDLPLLRAQHGQRALRALHFYPASDWLTLLWDAADMLEPVAGSTSTALEEVGAAVCRHFLDSLVGKLALALGGRGSPVDRVMHAPTTYSAGASYGQRTVERISRELAVLTIDQDIAPCPYHVGLIRAGVERSGQPVRVTGRAIALLRCEITVEALPYARPRTPQSV